MDNGIFEHYALVGRIRADLIEGKASLQIIGPAGDVEMSEVFPDYEEDLIRKLDVYWIDLRRQIRQQMEKDETEQLIDNATNGIGRGKDNDQV